MGKKREKSRLGGVPPPCRDLQASPHTQMLPASLAEEETKVINGLGLGWREEPQRGGRTLRQQRDYHDTL